MEITATGLKDDEINITQFSRKSIYLVQRFLLFGNSFVRRVIGRGPPDAGPLGRAGFQESQGQHPDCIVSHPCDCVAKLLSKPGV